MGKLFNELTPEEQQEWMKQMKRHSLLEKRIHSKVNEILHEEFNFVIDDPETSCIEMAKNGQNLRVTIWFDREVAVLKSYKTDDKQIWNYIVNTRCLNNPKTVSFDPPKRKNDFSTELVLSDKAKESLNEVYSSEEYKEYQELCEILLNK